MTSITATAPTTARHAARSEAWIDARAMVNRGWTANPRHAYPKRATLRSAPRESRPVATLRSALRSIRRAIPAHAAPVPHVLAA